MCLQLHEDPDRLVLKKNVEKTQVEKQKILQASGGRSGILSKPEIKKTNPDVVRKTNAASKESHRNPVTSKPPSVSVENATTSKPKPSDVKKASRSALSFFDRYLVSISMLYHVQCHDDHRY